MKQRRRQIRKKKFLGTIDLFEERFSELVEVLRTCRFLYALVAGLDVDTVNYHITSLPLALHYQCTGAKCRYK